MKEKEKKDLMKKYGINQVGNGSYGEGFFDCLQGIDKGTIKEVKQ